MKYTKQKDLPQGIQKEQQTQGITLEQRQGAGFLCIPFCFLPPSGALVSRENVKEAGASEIRKTQNRTQSARHKEITLDFYESVPQGQKANF